MNDKTISVTPVISVLMPVHNAEDTVGETIKSVLNQSFKDFEFIIINDASSDNTEEVIRGFDDERIKLVVNSVNKGVTESLNAGLSYCRGKYICRIDADDICYRKRFMYQYKYLEKNPNCLVLGAHYRKIIQNKIASFSSKHYKHVNNAKIRVLMLRNPPIGHPTVMFRRKLISEYGLNYDSGLSSAQDYDLWYRAMKYGKLHILNRPLVYYRVHDNQISKKSASRQCCNANSVRIALIKELIPDITNDELATHLALMTDLNPRESVTISKAENWVVKVCKINNELKVFDAGLFKKFMRKRLGYYKKSIQS